MTRAHPLSAALAAFLTVLVTTACAPQDRPSPEAEAYAGPFTSAEARALREEWDYVEGWFGGDRMRFGHLNVDRLVPMVELVGQGSVRTLADAPRLEVARYPVDTRDRGEVSLDDYVSNDARVDASIVLHRAEIVYERYVHMQPEERHLYFSVSKMVAGFLISTLEDEGLVDVTRRVDEYIPELVGTGWEGITVRNLLDMTSGIDCEETAEAYADIESCMLVMERSVGLQPELPTVSFREHLAAAPRGVQQGTRYEYASANTGMLMYVAEVVTGRRYPDLVSDLVWRHVGAESAAFMVSGDYEKGEAAAAHAGLFTTLRDLGRLGVFMLEQEAFHRKLLDGARLELFVGSSWGGAYETAPDRPTHAAWQSDVVFSDGDFGKGGWGGQFLYVSPSRDLVIAWFGTFGEDMVDPDLQSVARQLATARALW